MRFPPLRFAILLLLTFAAPIFAQRGDVPGEAQPPPPEDLEIPPAPVLSPEEAMQSFTVAPGFRVELVAADPLIHDPVAIAFDADGRLWVVEMSGYMPDLDGTGENEPVGKIVTLDDTDGDGAMDKRTVFLDGLVLPRAIAPIADGMLVAEPPHLWFCRDTNGDGVADEKTEIAGDYGRPGNPEHTANGLLWALDNWIYNAKHNVRFRYDRGEWKREDTIARGQWGITQDDTGRLFYNDNSDPVRGDLLPADYVARNPHYTRFATLDVSLAPDKSTYPIRVTPGINRGYRMLGPDAKLPRVTAACGLIAYRGDIFPEDYANDIFVCEPAGNLVQRYRLTPTANGGLTASNAYAAERAEFLASTDERFRPVNTALGPDGGLYIVDMYRGLIQHRIFVTSYLRSQVESRGLDKFINLGRIYRVVPENAPPRPSRPQLSRATAAQLVAHLSHPNGWWRDTAQRLLVERGDTSVVPTLRTLATSGDNALGRLHALWTLEGLGASDPATEQAALGDRDPPVVASALRLIGRRLAGTTDDKLVAPIISQLKHDAPAVRLHAMLALGESQASAAVAALTDLLRQSAAQPFVADAVISGLAGRELEMIERLVSANDGTARAAISTLTACVLREADPQNLSRVYAIAASSDRPTWSREAVLDGLRNVAPRRGDRRRMAFRLPAEPAELIALAERTGDPLARRATEVLETVTWPGKSTEAAAPRTAALTAAQQELFDQGKTTYLSLCAACHLPNGEGVSGLARPLVGSNWVLGGERALVRIVLHGKQGSGLPAPMPPLGTLDDRTIAGALTYIRREWGHLAPPVTPETVADVRRETAGRDEPWSEEELGRFDPQLEADR